MSNKPTILYCCLNWGLGHASRSVPIIEALLKKCNIVICSNGKALAFLQKKFPQCIFEDLPFPEVRYSHKSSQTTKLLRQLPALFKGIIRERKIIKTLIHKYKAQGIVSDNRYGCYSNETYNVFICHQLNIQLPSSVSIFKPIADFIHRKVISKFNECWVPDNPQIGISGKLSKFKLSIPKHYIGLISQFKPKISNHTPEKEKLVISSGPEPQKTIFNNKTTSFLNRKDTLIGDKEGVKKHQNGYMSVVFKSGDDLQSEIENHSIIISRSGYSSIMDYILLNKNAVLIPTPGQTEQEYLAQRCKEFGFQSFRQDTFSINDIRAVKELNIKINIKQNRHLLNDRILSFINKLR